MGFRYAGGTGIGARALLRPGWRLDTRYRDWEVLGAGEPVPPLSQIRATGWDAIVQFRTDLLAAGLRQSLGAPSVERDFPGGAPEVQAAAEEALGREPIRAERLHWPPAPGTVEVAIAPSAVRLQLGEPAVRLTLGTSLEATVEWRVSVTVIGGETEESYRARVDAASFDRAPPPFRGRLPAGAEPVTIAVELVRGTLRASGVLSLRNTPSALRTDVLFEPRALTLAGGALFTATMEAVGAGAGLIDLVQRRAPLPVTPTVSLLGSTLPGPGGTGFAGYEVTPVVVGANAGQHQTLALCIEIDPGTRAADLSAVRPFTGASNFGYFVTEPVIRRVAAARWRAMIDRSLSRTVPIRWSERPTEIGRVELRLAFGELDDAFLDVGTEGVPDSLHLTGTQSVAAVRAWFGRDDVTGELGEAGRPRTEGFRFRVFLLGSPLRVSGDEALDRWFDRLARQIATPLLRPTTSGVLAGDHSCAVSAPLGALWTRGTLRH